MDPMEVGFRGFELYLLVMARFMGVFVQAPLFASHHIPMQVRVGCALVASFAMFPALPLPPNLPDTLVNLAFAILYQILIGLIIGYVAFLVSAGAQFAGELIDIQLGLSIAASFDPSAGGTINLTRRFQLYLSFLIYLLINGHHFLFKAIAKSYHILPVDRMSYAGSMVEKLIGLSAGIFVVAIQISAPVMAALFITQVALGLLSRVAPQMNVFMLSFPLNIMIGLTLLSLSLVPVVSKAMPGFYQQLNSDLLDLIYTLRPR